MFGIFKDLNKLRPLLSKRDRWKFALLLGLMFLGSILEAISIGAIPIYVSFIMDPSSLSDRPWLSNYLPNLPKELNLKILMIASGLLLAFIILKNLFLTLVFYVQTRIVMYQRLKLGDRMFRAYQSAPFEWHLQKSSSEYLRNIHNDTAQVLTGMLMPFLDLIMSLIMIVIISGVMILNMPLPALLSLLITGVGVFAVIRVFQKRLQMLGQIAWKEDEAIIKSIQQGFGALIDARIIGCESYLQGIHRDSLSRLMRSHIQLSTIMKSSPYLIETFAVLGLLVIFTILVSTSNSLSEVLPVIALLGVATIRLKQIASKVAGSLNQMSSSRAYVPTIVNDLKILEEVESLRESKQVRSTKNEMFDSLCMEHVSYSYPGTSELAIENISLQINRGESIAFVGATGCGKSTLANLILGLLEPTSGVIYVNGIDIHQNIGNWREHLGYIPQSIYLVDDTIRANVAFGQTKEEIDENHVWDVLRSSNLDKHVKNLPQGLDTIVGERGVRLSGGQRQRLGIARALYTNPDVLIMDEATSALDNKTEDEVIQAIQNLKNDRTLIMIAHRLSTVEDCDRLYFMSNGKLVSEGRFEELKVSTPEFSEMARVIA